jgi:hypothetical protein
VKAGELITKLRAEQVDRANDLFGGPSRELFGTSSWTSQSAMTAGAEQSARHRQRNSRWLSQ